MHNISLNAIHCYIFGPHEAIIRQRKTERINTLHGHAVIACRQFWYEFNSQTRSDKFYICIAVISSNNLYRQFKDSL
jgi:hypothetical protein